MADLEVLQDHEGKWVACTVQPSIASGKLVIRLGVEPFTTQVDAGA